MSVLAQRFLYGTPILGGVVGLLFWDQRSGGVTGIAILAVLFGLGALVEFARMNRLGRRLEVAAAIALLLLLGARALAIGAARAVEGGSAAAGAEDYAGLELLIMALVPGVFVLLQLRLEPSAEPLRRAGLAVLGLAYVGLPIICLLELAASTEWGLGWLLFLVLVVKGNDSGAYLVGRKFGKTPLTRVSPKKTREGAVGGLALGVVVGVAIALLDPAAPFGAVAAAGLALPLGVLGQAGDLVESYFKRSAGVKDSGALIPAFGGVLDLLDSLLLAGPALLAVARVWEGTWSI